MSLNNRIILEQIRRGVASQISEAPTVITGSRKPTITNSYGQTVPDPNGTPITYEATIRIGPERASVKENGETPAGLETSFSNYALTDYITPIQENDEITLPDGSVYKAGPVEIFTQFGGKYQSTCPLTKITDATETPT